MPFGTHPPIPRKDKISVGFLVSQLKETLNLQLDACASEDACESHYVTEANLHRPGLALAGYIKLFTYQRIQIIGNTETNYLMHLNKEDRIKAFENLVKFDIPVIFITNGNEMPDYLLKMAQDRNIPVFVTPVETTKLMFLLRDFLEDQFAVQTIVHGSMVDVYGIGIMIAGKSGIGKSEVALDLVERGHRLVADDVNILTKKNNVLMASATDMNKHFMEIRGLGIIDIMSMFGIRAIRYQKRVEIVLELSLWSESENVERTGLDEDKVSILDVDVPIVHLPITPGKNITVIAEVIAMNHLLSHYGYDAAQAFQEKVQKHIADKKSKSGKNMPKRAIEYFEGDVE